MRSENDREASLLQLRISCDDDLGPSPFAFFVDERNSENEYYFAWASDYRVVIRDSRQTRREFEISLLASLYASHELLSDSRFVRNRAVELRHLAFVAHGSDLYLAIALSNSRILVYKMGIEIQLVTTLTATSGSVTISHLVGHRLSGVFCAILTSGQAKFFDVNGSLIATASGLIEPGDRMTSCSLHPARSIAAFCTNFGRCVFFDFANRLRIDTERFSEAILIGAEWVDIVLQNSVHTLCVVCSELGIYYVFDLMDADCAIQKTSKRNSWFAIGSAAETDVSETIKGLLIQPQITADLKCRTKSFTILPRSVLSSYFTEKQVTVDSRASLFVVSSDERGCLSIIDLVTVSHLICENPSFDEFAEPLLPAAALVSCQKSGYVLSVSEEAVLVLWNFNGGLNHVRTLKGIGTPFVYTDSAQISNHAIAFFSADATGLVVRTEWDSLSEVVSFKYLRSSRLPDTMLVSNTCCGNVLALCDRSGALEVWDLISGESLLFVDANVCGPQVHIKLSHAEDRTPFENNQMFLLTLGADGVLRRWNISIKQLERTKSNFAIKVTNKPIYTLALSPNNRTIVLAGANKKLYRVSSASLTLEANFTAHEAPISQLIFMRDSVSLLSASSDGKIKHWRLSTNGGVEAVQTFSGLEDKVANLSVAEQSGFVVVGAADGALYFFDINLSDLVQRCVEFSSPIFGLHCFQYKELELLAAYSADGAFKVFQINKDAFTKFEQEKKTQIKNEIAQIDALIDSGKYVEGFSLALKYARHEPFVRAAEKLSNPEKKSEDQHVLEDLIESMKEPREYEAYLLFCIQLSKKNATVPVAVWLLNAAITSDRVTQFIKVPGFNEFAQVMGRKLSTFQQKLDVLIEKSYILNEISSEISESI